MGDQSQSYTIKDLDTEHAEEVMKIFNHYVASGFAAFFDEPLPDMFFSRLREMARGYPAVAAVAADGTVAGFAFLRAFHAAPTFNRTAETTYFIHPDHTRKGLGKLLLDRLIEESPGVGVDNLVASVSSLNAESLAFHEKNGFRESGRLAAVGRKRGADFDLVLMQRFLKSES